MICHHAASICASSLEWEEESEQNPEKLFPLEKPAGMKKRILAAGFVFMST